MKYVPPYGSPGAEDPYINGDPSIARQGSIIPAGAVEHPQREIVNFIENSDQAPAEGDLEQLTRGIRNQWVNFCVDTGSVNNLSVALVPALQAYKQGTPLRVLAANANTGPTSINVNALGNRPVTRSSGAQLQPDDIRAGMVALLVDDGTKFQLMNYLGAVGGITNNYHFDIPYAEDTSLAQNSIVANYGAEYGAVAAVAGDLVLVKVAATNSGPVMFTVNALAPQPIYRNDGQPLQSYDLLVGECILIEYNTTYWQMLRLVRSQVYFKLSADLTLYVRTDGNDTTGDGATNTAARAFKTVQRAVDFVRASWLIAGRTVTIQLGITGTYVGSVTISDLPGTIVIKGDVDHPEQYVLQATPNMSTVNLGGAGTNVFIQGVYLSLVTTNHHNLQCNYGATVSLYNMWFGGVKSYAHVASTAGSVRASGYIHFWQNAETAFSLGGGASLMIGLWSTVITGHGNHYFTAFIYCSLGSTAQITYPYCTMSGYSTGMRYIADMNSVILTGGGAYYLPGNVDGVTNSNGLYL